MTVYITTENETIRGVFRKIEDALFNILDNIEDGAEICLVKIGPDVRLSCSGNKYQILRYELWE